MSAITKIAVSRSQAEEQNLQSNGFKKINVILNKDQQGNPTYIWYKQQHGSAPITRIQFSYNSDMSAGLANAGYIKVYESPIPESSVYISYLKGTTNYDTPIVDLQVSTNPEDEALKMKMGWERVGCNMSEANGKWVYLWVNRAQPTHICDVTATNSYGTDVDLFKEGYIRIDESTNTIFLGILPPINLSSNNFLWYRQTPDDKQAITDLQISTNTNQYQQYQQQGYTPVSVNLNEGNGGNAVYLWYKKENGQTPVKSMLLLLDTSATSKFEKNGMTVIKENINNGNNTKMRYLCVKMNSDEFF